MNTIKVRLVLDTLIIVCDKFSKSLNVTRNLNIRISNKFNFAITATISGYDSKYRIGLKQYND